MESTLPSHREPTLRDIPFRLSYSSSDDPLHTFYIPALSVSLRYDRMAGFFTSSTLAIAAAGVAHLVAGGGRMRLLVGAQLSPEDVEAIRKGHALQAVVAERMRHDLPTPEALADRLMRDRLGVLAWMVANGSLETRVVLPTGPDGLPLPAAEAREYFHAKTGIFTDAAGNQVAFNGSINESTTGWQRNYEMFLVFRSWTEEGKRYIAEVRRRFKRLWEHREPDWIAFPIPKAVRRRLLRYAPAQAPTRDPLEHGSSLPPQQAQVLLHFLRDAPHLVGARDLGEATAPILPWPHQRTVARQIVRTFPARYLLADEVGLGKTVEAGLLLRQLWLSGLVQRALILAPKSVLRQWQEELYEKFALHVPLYDGQRFICPDRRQETPSTPNPWDSVALALASSQLVKRRERQHVLLEARPWDLVIVDEAHHARRRDFLNLRQYRPNRLLELLNRLQKRTRGLILMTATPMQVHPIEVWDLLRLLGLSDVWGAEGEAFLRFYEELRRAPDERDWPFIFHLLRAELEMRGGQLDPRFEQEARRTIGRVEWERLRQLLREPSQSHRTFRTLSPQAKSVADDLVRHHTPLKRLIFRNTRQLLREYVRQGVLRSKVPTRRPQLVWIPMREEERELYERIEEYISRFYRKYEGERKGLGFVMTVYRRRLTSSFYAVQRSLERRLAFLRGQARLALSEDDLDPELEEATLNLDVDEEGPVWEDRALFREEIAYVEDFVHALKGLGRHDSKVEQLLNDLREVFCQRETVLVFTQYTDPMDFLREQLRQSYGSQVACYSGRGGERWDGTMWVQVTKEEIKNAFREGEEIKVLLCTEAASEGLNLQTCGVLINYDMPWNPMRVEQRIGRIDRIGQRYDEVWIRNYFYEETVEAAIYQALSRRIHWFQDVVGPLQPILARVGRAIETVAMTPEAERERALQDELARLQEALNRGEEGLNLDEWAGHAETFSGVETPVTLPELEAILTRAPRLRLHFRPHETIANAFRLMWDGEEIGVTFHPQTFDAHPNTLQFLTFGTPLLNSLLESVLPREGAEARIGPLLRLEVKDPLRRVAYYALDAGGRPRRLSRLAEVQTALEAPRPADEWPKAAIEAARRELHQRVQEEVETLQRFQRRLHQAQARAKAVQAAHLLLRAALIEIALGRQANALERKAYPAAFDMQAVIGLKRHGYPWTALLKLASAHLQKPHPADPFFREIQKETAKQLKQRFNRIRQQAEHLLQR